MIKRPLALLLIGTLLISLSGCALFWGTDKDHKFASDVAAHKEQAEDGLFYDNQHFITHVQIFLRDFRKMHKLWDRHFMNYDWNDPYID